MGAKINCFHCKYLKITWEPAFPYACTAIGFKSRMIPSFEVQKDSQMECQFFMMKDSAANNKEREG
jgi:hypothetical protein